MAEQSASVAFNDSAPEAERIGALSELQQTHMPGEADLLPPAHVREIIDVALESFSTPMAKAISDYPVPYPSLNVREHRRGMQSIALDEVTINMQGDYWEKNATLTFDALRNMVRQTPILNAVVMTRVRQVQRFCRISEKNIDAPGFEIRHVDRKHQLTKSEQESINLLNRFIMNCGWEFKPRLRRSLGRDSFSQFMAKSVRDSLVLDSAPIETEWKRNKRLGFDGFYAVDGATIRLCNERGYHGNDQIFALQVVQGRISAAYTHDDLIYEARNPTTDVVNAGYGTSETELLIRVVTGYLNAMTYNIKGFDSNQIPKGMLNLVGSYDDDQLRAFRRYWNALLKGAGNAWNLPVMVSKDQNSKATFEKFGVEFNEMYFAKWMTFLTSIICALYGISPSEINFDSFSGGNSSPLSGSDTAERLAASKDSGLRPLLAAYENTISDYLVSEFSDDLVFRWTGLDPEDGAARQRMRELVLTVNEIRAEEGHEAMEGPLGDAPVNPPLLQAWMQINGAGDSSDEDGGGRGPGNADLQATEGSDPDAAPNNDGQPDDANDTAASGFGAPTQNDFGKSFGLAPVFTNEDLFA